MPERKQIGCYLAKADGEKLTAYAGGMELSRARLCGLLVLRELKQGRLAALKQKFRGSEIKKGFSRVTARIANERTKDEFKTHVANAGLGSDDAAALLFRAELEECWLEGALKI